MRIAIFVFVINVGSGIERTIGATTRGARHSFRLPNGLFSHPEVTHPKRNGRDTDESTRAVESVKKRYRQPLQLPISVVGQERFAFSVSE
jgi:hypothetical protein